MYEKRIQMRKGAVFIIFEEDKKYVSMMRCSDHSHLSTRVASSTTTLSTRQFAEDKRHIQ